MSALDDTPTNINFLSPIGLKFSIKRAPNVNFFIQKVNVPDINIPNISVSNPFSNIPMSGEHVTFGKLNIDFKVNEDLDNFQEIFNWLIALGKPQNFEQYLTIEQMNSYTGKGLFSDISLIALTDRKNPNIEFLYVDAFPVSLSGLKFNTTEKDINFLTASASFMYTYYTISKII